MKMLVLAIVLTSSSVNADMGRVSWFDQQNGNGFINPTSINEKGEVVIDTGISVFVHLSVIVPNADGVRSLYAGQTVDFQAVQGQNGLQATIVTPME